MMGSCILQPRFCVRCDIAVGVVRPAQLGSRLAGVRPISAIPLVALVTQKLPLLLQPALANVGDGQEPFWAS